MKGPVRYVIPKADDAETAVLDFTWKTNWLLVKRVHRDADRGVPHELVWSTLDESTTIHFIEDEIVQFPYIVIKGGDVDRIEGEVREGLETFSDEEIFRWVDGGGTGGDRMQAIAHLGVAAPRSFDREFFRRFEAAFDDSDPQVQRTAIWASGYSSWSEFVPILERLAAEDPHEEVREDASIMLKAFRGQKDEE